MLEPCDGKLSRRVLRGERGCEAPDLPGAEFESKEPKEQGNKICFLTFL
jgi:hypothetical protein